MVSLRRLPLILLLVSLAALHACDDFLEDMPDDLRVTLLNFRMSPDSLDLAHDPARIVARADIETNAVVVGASFRLVGPFASANGGEAPTGAVTLECAPQTPVEENGARTGWECSMELGGLVQEGFYRIESVGFHLANGSTIDFSGTRLAELGYPVAVRVGRDRVSSIVVEGGDGQEAGVLERLPVPLEARVEYLSGRPAAGVEVRWTVLAGDGEVIVDVATTDAEGRVRASWELGPRAGHQEVVAEVVNEEASAVFRATAHPAPATDVEAVAGDAQQGPISTTLPIPLQIRVTDPFGNPVVGVAVTWSAVGEGAGTVTPPEGETDADGIAEAVWTLSNAVGEQRAVAVVTLGGAAIEIPFLATADAGQPATFAIVEGDGQTGPVGATLAGPLTVLVEDADGNPVGGASITFTPSAGSGSVAPATVETDEGGRASTLWTLGEVAGTHAVHASLPSEDDAPDLIFEASAHPGPAAAAEIVAGDDQEGPVGAALPIPLEIRVTDAFENPVSGVAVAWAPVGEDHGALVPAQGETDADGIASTVWTLGGAVGEQEAVAVVTLGESTVEIPFRAAAHTTFPEAFSIVSGNEQTGPVAAPLEDPLTVLVEDGSGNPIAGVAVTFTPAEGSGTASPTTVETNEDGLASAIWTLGTVAGAQTLEASILSGDFTLLFEARAEAGSPAELVIVEGDGQTGPVGTVLPTPLTVLVRDAYGNPVPNALITLVAVDGRSGVDPTSGRTDEDGLLSAAWTLSTSIGLHVIEVSVANSDLSVLVSATAEPGPPADLEVMEGDEQVGIVEEPLADSLGVRVLDEYGNPLPGVEVTWTIVSGGGSIVETSMTDEDGIARAEWVLGSEPGVQEVEASVDGIEGGVIFEATATPASSESFTIVGGEDQTGPVGAAVDIPLTVLLEDGAGNPIVGETVTFTVAEGSGSVDPVTVDTDGDGLASTVWTLGTGVGAQEVEASVMDGALTLLFEATAEAGPAAELEIVEGDEQVGIVEEPLADSLVVRVLDEFGNPVPEVEVTWTVLSGDGALPESSVTDAEGIARAEWVLGLEPGVQEVEASVDGVEDGVIFEATATPAPGAPATIELGPEDLVLDRALEPVALDATVLDGNGDPVPGAVVSWSSSEPEIVEINEETGVVRALADGAAVITATSGDAEGELEVEVELARLIELVEINGEPVTMDEAPFDIEGSAAFRLRVQTGSGSAFGGLVIEGGDDVDGFEEFGRLDAPVASGAWAFLDLTPVVLPAGAYDLRVGAWDEEDPESITEETRFGVIVTRPDDETAPVITILSPEADAEVSEDGFDLELLIEDEGGIWRWSVVLEDDPVVVLAGETILEAGVTEVERTVTVPALAIGTRTFLIEATDGAGNHAEDRITVVVGDDDPGPEPGEARFVGVVDDDGVTRFAWSEDGIDWILGSGASPDAGSVTGRLIHNGDHWIALVAPGGTGSATVYRSEDGIAWTPATSPPANPLRHAVWVGTGSELGLGWIGIADGAMYSSTNGSVWQLLANSGGSSVASDGVRIVRTTAPDVLDIQVQISTDGSTWHNAPSMNGLYEHVAWNGQAWVLAGPQGRLARSPDAYHWTEMTPFLIPYSEMLEVIWTGTRWVIPGYDGLSNLAEWLHTGNADGTDWQRVTLAGSGRQSSFAIGSGGAVGTTTEGDVLIGDGMSFTAHQPNLPVLAVGARDAVLPPTAQPIAIGSPPGGTTHIQNEPVTLALEGPGPFPGTVEWFSDRDGALGIGTPVDATLATLGTHRIIARWTPPSAPISVAVLTIEVVEDSDSDEVIFEDSALETVVRSALGIPTGPILRDDMAGLTTLTAIARGISSLVGIEHAVNLTHLQLGSNNIIDLSPLAELVAFENLQIANNNISDISTIEGLTALDVLNISSNNISDVSPLAGLTDLRVLNLSLNEITDLSPLAGLTSLETLQVSNNQLSDIAVVENFSSLRALFASTNQLSDVSVLSSLPQLDSLALLGNEIIDISPLPDLSSLTYLSMSSNPIGDFSPLASMTGLVTLLLAETGADDLAFVTDLTNLRALFLADNNITDISPMAGLTLLDAVRLQNNAIVNISALANLPRLRTLDISRNQITNVSPLAGLTNLTNVNLLLNQVASLAPLANSAVFRPFSSPNSFDVRGNPPLDPAVACGHLATLGGRGWTVLHNLVGC